jgi:uncharacterized protein
MAQRTDTFDLERLGLTSGEGRRFDLHARTGSFDFGGQRYETVPELAPVRLDVSRTTGNGWALRLRFESGLEGPCWRCLEPAAPHFEVDAREVSQPGAGDEELISPYVGDDGELDLQAWVHDALALALPAQITCRPDCAGLCAQCGANLNEAPDHAHEAPRDPRFDKLSELKFD